MAAVVERMNARLECKSAVNNGFAFVISFGHFFLPVRRRRIGHATEYRHLCVTDSRRIAEDSLRVFLFFPSYKV